VDFFCCTFVPVVNRHLFCSRDAFLLFLGFSTMTTAATTNAMAPVFMKGAGTHVIHIGGTPLWRLYAALAHEFGVDFRNIWTPSAGQDSVNVRVDVDVILLEVWRILEADGVAPGRLGALRRARDASRQKGLDPAKNAKVVQVYHANNQSESLLYAAAS
jgi:hypothetical protein